MELIERNHKSEIKFSLSIILHKEINSLRSTFECWVTSIIHKTIQSQMKKKRY